MEQTMIPVDEISTVFADLDPIPQDDGPEPVCAIQYPSSFLISYNYMRAVWKCNEFSERTLRLSATCLRLNPANYTVWHYRRQCMKNMGVMGDPKHIRVDLDLAATLGGDNPKNYQIWYHRRTLLEQHGIDNFLEKELNYISEVLEEDSKNYHAWSHRQWIIQEANNEQVWLNELEFAQKLIQQDPRNNSAWNQRWFASHRAKKDPLSLEAARTEMDFAIEKGAQIDPYNESPWRYLIGLLKEQQKQLGKTNPECQSMLEEYERKAFEIRDVLFHANRNPDSCSNLTAARIDILEMIGGRTNLEQAISFAEGLANEHDPIRKKYWMLRMDTMKQKVEKTSGSS